MMMKKLAETPEGKGTVVTIETSRNWRNGILYPLTDVAHFEEIVAGSKHAHA